MVEVTRGLAIKSFLWKFLERSSVQVIQFIVTIILARILLPEEYGVIALLMVFINIFQVIVDGGFNTALIQKKDVDNTDYSTIFFFGLLMSSIIYLVLYFLAPTIALFYSQPELTSVIRVLGVILIVYAVNAVQNANISRNLLFRKSFCCNLSAIVVSGIIGVILAYNGYGVWALVFQMLLSQLILTMAMWFILGWRPNFVFSIPRLKTLLDYGWKIFASNIIITLFVNIRKLIIGKLFAPSSLAFFERGDQFPSLIMNNVQTSVQSVLFPVFSIEQDNKLRIKQMLRRATKMNCFVIYPMMVILIVSAKPLILFLLTEKWLPAVGFMQIFCLANLFKPLTIPNLEAIKALGYSEISLKLELIKKTIEVVLLVISAFIGVYAIAWSIVVFNFLCVFINLYPNIRLLNYTISDQIKDALPTLLIALFMGGVVYWIQFLQIPLVVVFMLQFVFGCIIYIGICFCFRDESIMYVYEFLKLQIHSQKSSS